MDLTAWMEQWHMLPEKGGLVLCAVSGGRDSVCLLHYLWSISERRGFSVAAAHYNHHMRPTAQRDEDFVRGLCEQLHLRRQSPVVVWKRRDADCATSFWNVWRRNWGQ